MCIICAEYVCAHFSVCILWVRVQTRVCLSTQWVRRRPRVSVLTSHLGSDRVFCLPLSPAGQLALELPRSCLWPPNHAGGTQGLQMHAVTSIAHLITVQQALSPRAITLGTSLTAIYVSGWFYLPSDELLIIAEDLKIPDQSVCCVVDEASRGTWEEDSFLRLRGPWNMWELQSTPNSLPYVTTVNSQRREAEDSRELGYKAIYGTFRIPQVQFSPTKISCKY